MGRRGPPARCQIGRGRQALVEQNSERHTPYAKTLMNEHYLDTVRLLLSIAPDVFSTSHFGESAARLDADALRTPA